MSTERRIQYSEERVTGGATDDIGIGIVYDVFEGERRAFGILVQMSGTAGAIASARQGDPAAILRDHAERLAHEALAAPGFEPPVPGEFVRVWITGSDIERYLD